MSKNKVAYDALKAEIKDLIKSVEVRQIILKEQKVFFSHEEVLLILNN